MVDILLKYLGRLNFALYGTFEGLIITDICTNRLYKCIYF